MKEILGARCTDTELFAVPAGIPGWKRVLDITCIILASPIVLPLGLLIALGIKLVSKGPILFLQKRVGYLGQPFQCFKFRSMIFNAETSCHKELTTRMIHSDKPMTKLDAKGDKRLILGGGLLRATGLDELPQLINVVLGEMSLVGPRPGTTYEYEEYQAWHKLRCRGLPGLTGLWQVCGKNKTNFDQMVRFDLRYLRNQSAWLDLQIMFRTIPALISQARETAAARNGHSQNPAQDEHEAHNAKEAL